ncbi:rCG37678 [Rattus norvegicus]|uniref:RCG37678 n=1 Tax=Rattus norvegicus TaxID=10116 RepID=A6JEY4_RAT|nr:rCG37678 [Rattus norvegicus]
MKDVLVSRSYDFYLQSCRLESFLPQQGLCYPLWLDNPLDDGQTVCSA